MSQKTLQKKTRDMSVFDRIHKENIVHVSIKYVSYSAKQNVINTTNAVDTGVLEIFFMVWNQSIFGAVSLCLFINSFDLTEDV